MTVDQWANLLSWPAAALAFVYCGWTIRRYQKGREHIAHTVTTVLVAVAAAGFLLRPLAALGTLPDPGRDAAALVVRVVFLVFGAGLVWNLLDTWLDRRKHRP